MNINKTDGITYQEVFEGQIPHMLYWKLGSLNPFNSKPQAEHFGMVNGVSVLGGKQSFNVMKPFASRNEPWLSVDYDNLDFTHIKKNDVDQFRWETPLGVLTAQRHDNHMTEYPVKTVEDISLWQYIQGNQVYSRNSAFTDSEAQSSRNLGFKWSPVQKLLQFETGVENFYYFLSDAPDQMTGLLYIMHRKNLEALAVGFESCPDSRVLYLVENTSSQLISPDMYRRLTLPHVKKYVDMAHQNGKTCVVHMCGCLTALLDCFKDTGMDGIESVTPSPIGDTDYMAVRRYFGDDFVIIGRLNAQLFVDKKKNDILSTLNNLIPESLIHTPFALVITVDGMQVSESNVYELINALKDFNSQYAFDYVCK